MAQPSELKLLKHTRELLTKTPSQFHFICPALKWAYYELTDLYIEHEYLIERYPEIYEWIEETGRAYPLDDNEDNFGYERPWGVEFPKRLELLDQKIKELEKK